MLEKVALKRSESGHMALHCSPARLSFRVCGLGGRAGCVSRRALTIARSRLIARSLSGVGHSAGRGGIPHAPRPVYPADQHLASKAWRLHRPVEFESFVSCCCAVSSRHGGGNRSGNVAVPALVSSRSARRAPARLGSRLRSNRLPQRHPRPGQFRLQFHPALARSLRHAPFRTGPDDDRQPAHHREP